ncbi:MAG: hypothetical protein ABSB80_10805 [Methanoregula sp.]|jgi:hypothetical protein
MDAFPFLDIIHIFTILFGIFGAALIIYGACGQLPVSFFSR